MQALEKEFGRPVKTIQNEPRPLDLDLIAFGHETRNSPALVLPHPRAHGREPGDARGGNHPLEAEFLDQRGLERSDLLRRKPADRDDLVARERLAVGVGAKVAKDDKLVTMEAMKMQTTIYAQADGVVSEILAQVGETVESKDLLMRLKA